MGFGATASELESSSRNSIVKVVVIRTVSNIKYSFRYWTSGNESVFEGFGRVIESLSNWNSLNKSLLSVLTAPTLSRAQLRLTARLRESDIPSVLGACYIALK
ncbi:unnamed protein product [Calicophoron daubneyi]|uniref:Uncharacterized protein n=1 Tax=Calicophoron daubneyi TaxID=300641 RepID=A0AAV2TZ07_CALDB